MDKDLFERCILHLLSNAREAADGVTHITIRAYREEGEAIIEVTDAGKGISPEDTNRVFDPFYSSKPYSAGMGLTFVHFVITEFSGKVDIKSDQVAGTSFRIRLPLDAPVSKI